MSRVKYKFTFAVVAIFVIVFIIIMIDFGLNGSISPEKFRAYKMSKRTGDTSQKPTEWFTISRAYPYKDIPYQAYRAALSRAEAIYYASASLDVFPCEPVGPYNVGGRITALAADANTPGLIYAGAALGGVFKSTDNGENWEPISDDVPSLSVGDIALDPEDSDVLYFGTGEANSSGDSYAGTGLYRTTDGGLNWKFLGLPESRHIGRIAIDPTDNQKIFVACMGSLFSTNPDRGLYRSTNGGDSWEQVLSVNDSTGCIDVVINPQNTDIIFAAMWQRIRGPRDRRGGGIHSGIYRSTNAGDNWELLSTGLPAPHPDNGRIGLAIAPSNPNVIYASYVNHPGDFMGVWRSTDGGDTWTSISPDLTGGEGGGNLLFGTLTTISQSLLNPQIIWAGTDDSRVWVTDDGGGNWNLVSENLPERWCTRVTADVFDEATAFATFSGYSVDDLMPHIFKTDDYGLTWADISVNLEGIPVNDILPDPMRDGWLYIGTDFGMFYTDDGGQIWQAMSPDHPIVPVFDIDLHNNISKLVSGTHGRSMYAFDLGAVGISEPDSRPIAYSLNQNYPNPFNAETNISFEAQKAGRVQLNVYDINGRLIETLLNQNISAGEHRLTFDASGLAGGTYFLSLKADGYQGSKKMTLIK